MQKPHQGVSLHGTQTFLQGHGNSREKGRARLNNDKGAFFSHIAFSVCFELQMWLIGDIDSLTIFTHTPSNLIRCHHLNNLHPMILCTVCNPVNATRNKVNK